MPPHIWHARAVAGHMSVFDYRLFIDACLRDPAPPGLDRIRARWPQHGHHIDAAVRFVGTMAGNKRGAPEGDSVGSDNDSDRDSDSDDDEAGRKRAIDDDGAADPVDAITAKMRRAGLGTRARTPIDGLEHVPLAVWKDVFDHMRPSEFDTFGAFVEEIAHRLNSIDYWEGQLRRRYPDAFALYAKIMGVRATAVAPDFVRRLYGAIDAGAYRGGVQLLDAVGGAQSDTDARVADESGVPLIVEPFVLRVPTAAAAGRVIACPDNSVFVRHADGKSERRSSSAAVNEHAPAWIDRGFVSVQVRGIIVTGDTVHRMVRAMRANHSLTHLVLNRASIADDAGAALFDGLTASGHLRVLSLTGNLLAGETARAIGRAAAAGRCALTDLRLDENPLLGAHHGALAAVVDAAPLEALSLAACGLAEGGVASLMARAMESDTLRAMSMARNLDAVGTASMLMSLAPTARLLALDRDGWHAYAWTRRDSARLAVEF